MQKEARITGPTASWAGAVAQFTQGFAYDRWIDSLGLPIHTGYYIEDLRTVPVE
ncbi:MAG: hypothetical protein HW416_897, partial [Chloroflexi bacterium]|nr:hypothetical protein [Chloroflexota bacterium]